ncbi:MAG TPA: VOC family protein [Ferrovibrio sp.]|uniref:VOC family protein n=1 Tax=Ferrovibrio sp. TaxID=1917215 RepID=UPI002ED60E4A
MVSPIPQGFGSVTPYLVLTSAAKAIEFYKQALGAREVFRMPAPDGERLMHAEIRIGTSPVLLCDSFPEFGGPPPVRDGAGVGVHLYVEDVDAVVAKAEALGARITMPVADMFWGDRYGKLLDPFGVMWSVATHIKDLSPQEMEAAAKQVFGG